jgi:hypothetical protein
MTLVKKAVLMAGLTALAIGTMAAPAAAVTPSIAFVNGYPGRKVDVCVGNNEVKGRLAYGKGAIRSVGTGTKTIRFRAASAGSCNGQVLGTKVLTLVDDDDRTLVITKQAPKVVEFDNIPVPTDPLINYAYFRHAADLGPAVIGHEDLTIQVPEPAADPTPFLKGDTDLFTHPDPELMLVSATPATGVEAFVSKEILTLEDRRTEIILVGTKRSNARFAFLVRPLAEP